MPHSILIIEDQDADFEAIERGLRRLGVEYPVTRCTDAEDALDYLYGRGVHRRNPGEQQPPTIVLLDLKLDGGDGREVLARVKQDDYLKAIPIIVWSGSNDPHDVEISYRLGANSFVRKTFDFSEVNETLERLARFWLETAVLPPIPNAPY
ncbi:MAG: response regulator receiver protein [Chthoniobacteraceae bacterium]|nr:response regulator receiver protein [Chthoniobacteraceae bacterium]